MRKLILAPMALACLIGAAAAQQAPTMNVGNFPATQAVTQSGTWGFGLTGPIPAGSNVIGGVTQSGTWSVGLAAGSNAIGSVLADLRVSGAAVGSGNPVPVTIGNFPATQTIAGSVTANIGTTNGLGLDTSLQSIRTALGSPLQAGGSVSISGTPTFNLGTLNGAATAANQTTANGSLASIVANTTGGATAANQASEIAQLTAANARSAYSADFYQTSVAANAAVNGTSRDVGASPSPYTWVSFTGSATVANGKFILQASNDNFTANFITVAGASVATASSSQDGTSTNPITIQDRVRYRYYRIVYVNTSSSAQITGSLSLTAN